jgi:hypothetical protein
MELGRPLASPILFPLGDGWVPARHSNKSSSRRGSESRLGPRRVQPPAAVARAMSRSAVGPRCLTAMSSPDNVVEVKGSAGVPGLPHGQQTDSSAST